MNYDFSSAFANFIISLGVMWKGMLAIFVVILIIYLSILALGKAFPSDHSAH